jgi:alkanesulfonate monooxygenase SsuD/methylene tetrahydromethanopterin reductase-like flavin-dependent oxidoreductase (luciferase family)
MKAETLLPLGKLDPGLREPDDSLNLNEVASDAAAAESLGYQTLLLEETKDDPFQVLTMAALATRRVNIGTSVVIAFVRSPYMIAHAACIALSLKHLFGIRAVSNNFQVESLGGGAETERHFLAGFIA